MKKEIIEYLGKNQGSDIHQISKALNVEEISILRAVNELSNDGYVTLCTPVHLSDENSSSVRYKLTEKEFKK